MKRGRLSEFFVGVGVKRLVGTEVDPRVSKGHEFQGVKAFQDFLGVPSEKRRVKASFIWLSDEIEPLKIDGEATWYDSRRGQQHRDPEPRLYYPAAAESVVYRAADGDTLFLGLLRDGDLLFLMCAAGSVIEQQLLWLFGLEIEAADLISRDLRHDDGINIGLAARYVLELIGLEAGTADDRWLDLLLSKFKSGFPSTARFSQFAREHAEQVDLYDDPDGALMTWLELEEEMFLTLEKHVIAERLKNGFLLESGVDVDGFIQFSLSVQNRRKARAGYSLENHLEIIFSESGVSYERGATTEGKKKPDFLFPSSSAYKNLAFPEAGLILLGSKSTCKDRWRQVLSEGQRVAKKHLITLEPGISLPQTQEMQREGLQLVIPSSLHATYKPDQTDWLMTLRDFIREVRNRQVVYPLDRH